MTTNAPTTAEITGAAARLNFVLAGDAIFTLTSKRTGKRFTYRVSTKKARREGEEPARFASVLTGSDNENDYSYAGMVFPTRGAARGLLAFRTTRGSVLKPTSPSVSALIWFAKHPGSEAVEFRHEGRCCRCARLLTDPESIDSGIGPVCRRKAARAREDRHDAHVEFLERQQ
jgi:hypothetical protein